MKKILVLLLVGLFMVVSAQADEPGDLGSYECLLVQLEAQAEVEAGMPYKNHGQMVSTAARLVGKYTHLPESGISRECASCIIPQFAHSIPITEQEPCGADSPNPECDPALDFVTGALTLTSDEVEREYYLKLPSPYDSKISYPLVFGFHGFTSDYTSFTEGYYDLQEVVGDEAILVYPNALETNGETQWDLEADLGFFDDLYAELEANLCFDKRKVFAVGHSNGAGFTNMLGCRRGDVLRAIGPVSGIFSEDYEEKACIGQVASITMHGDNDTTIPQELALPGRDYWVAINSCSSEASGTTQGVDPSCVAYADCDPEYPVQYCEYSGKHNWPDFGGEAIWTFFKSLVPAIPSSTPGTGDPPTLAKGSASIKIKFPLDFVGTPDMISLSLYASGTTLPPVSAPKHILTNGFPPGEYTLGQVKEYNEVKIVLWGVEFGDYAFLVAVYVEGGVYPVPTPGKDYMGLQEITIDSSTINIETPFELELLVYE